MPTADVVVIAHAGLDDYASLAQLAKAVPLPTQWNITAWRTPRSDIPTNPEEQARWLDDQWLRVDDWIDQTLRPR